MWPRRLAGFAFAAMVAGCTLVVSTSGLSDGAGVVDGGQPPAPHEASSGAVAIDGAILPAPDGGAPTSCKALMTLKPPPPSGVYMIDPDGAGPELAFAAYCDLAGDGGGWTLLLKAKPDVDYGNPYWTDTRTLGTDKPNLDVAPAKLAGFMSMPFDAVRVGIREQDATIVRYVVLPVKAASLRALFQGGEVPTSLGRAAWLSLLESPRSQDGCNAEGFNLVRGAPGDRFANVRVGIIFNNESNCISPDSYIAIGGWEGTGNHASINGAAGTPREPNEVGYIEVR